MIQEKILCAAIWFPEYHKRPTHGPKNVDSGIVLCGRRHPDVIGQWAALTGTSLPAAHLQGFLTSDNRFVDRVEGLIIAVQALQGKRYGLGNLGWIYELEDRLKAAQFTDGKAQLYSEDLY